MKRLNPLYVIAMDENNNTIQVGEENDLLSSGLVASDVRWTMIKKLDQPIEVKARIRYRHKEAKAVVSPESGDTVSVRFDDPQKAINWLLYLLD